jgi:hypothetical protein
MTEQQQHRRQTGASKCSKRLQPVAMWPRRAVTTASAAKSSTSGADAIKPMASWVCETGRKGHITVHEPHHLRSSRRFSICVSTITWAMAHSHVFAALPRDRDC